MIDFLEHFGHGAVQLIIFMTVITIISVTTMFGEKTMLAHIGETISAPVSEDGFSTSGTYADTQTSKSMEHSASVIHLKTAPKKNAVISYVDFLSVTEGTNEIPYDIISVEDDITEENAVSTGQVSFDKSSKTITFNEKGTYRIRVRTNGTSVSRKSFIVTVTK